MSDIPSIEIIKPATGKVFEPKIEYAGNVYFYDDLIKQDLKTLRDIRATMVVQLKHRQSLLIDYLENYDNHSKERINHHERKLWLINMNLRVLKKLIKAKENQNRPVSSSFIDIARERLPAALFEEILESAKQKKALNDLCINKD